MTPSDKKFVEDLIEAKTSACRDCRAARAEEKKREIRRRGDAVLAMPQAERLAALRAMTHTERVAILSAIDLEIAIDLVRTADTQDQRMILGALAPAVAGNAIVWTIDLIRFYRVRNVDRLSERTSSCEVTDDQHARLVACGYGGLTSYHRGVHHWKGWPLFYDEPRTGAVHAEKEWILSQSQLETLLDVDKRLAELVAMSKLVVEPMTERECRALMAKG